MNPKRILVVEDDPVMLQVISRIISSEGFDVVPCNNGPKAVHEALTSKPALILLDLMMPSPDQGLCPAFDGHTVLSWHASVADLRDTPVIVISAKPAAQFKRRTIDEGACAYLQKPLDRKRLLSAVKIALDDGHQGQPEETPSRAFANLEVLYPPPSVDDTNWRMEEEIETGYLTGVTRTAKHRHNHL